MRTSIRVLASLALSSIAVTATAAGSAPVLAHETEKMPIDHVVVLMQENRAFDNYFGRLHFQGQPHATPEPPGAHNPNPLDPKGPPIKAFHQPSYCEVADLNHSWTGAHQEFDHGRMDGFTTANVEPKDPTGSRTMGYYDRTDLPYYYALYNTFAIGDHYFSSVLGPTFPNRFYLLAGTSFGHIQNDLPTTPDQFSQRTVFNSLDEAGVSWKVYFTDVAFASIFSYVRAHAAGHLLPISAYYADAAAGALPQVAFVDPGFFGTRNTETDEHPPANIQVGEKFVSEVAGALMRSPNWSSSAMFLTYDENGGFFDHMAPPRAVVPDGIPPMLKAGDVAAAFDRYGFRVPAVVISPFAKPHYVSHRTHDHTSILRFIEKRFGLPALTRRDAAANPMLEFFDFEDPAFSTPPALPAAPIDAAHAAQCAAMV